MSFGDDTRTFLKSTASLVNTASGEVDCLDDPAGLAAYLRAEGWTGEVLGTRQELASVRSLRERLRQFWTADGDDDIANLVNMLLTESNAAPYLARHDQLDWHLHLTTDDAPVAHRIAAEAAMGMLTLVVARDLNRLRSCAAPGCTRVLVDLSKNRSRRYCDGAGCGNRVNVAAYRQRRRTDRLVQPSSSSVSSR